MSDVILVNNLKKSYGKHTVLKGVTFSVRKGEIFALLGSNGAGKTTSLECLEGLKAYDGGSIEKHGTTGIQLQSSSLPAHIKPLESMNFPKSSTGSFPLVRKGVFIWRLPSSATQIFCFWMNLQPGWMWKPKMLSTIRSVL